MIDVLDFFSFDTHESRVSCIAHCTSLEDAADAAPSSGCAELSESRGEGIQLEMQSKAAGTAVAYASTGKTDAGREGTRVFDE